LDSYATLVLGSVSLGLALAAPVGPIGAAAIRGGLTDGSRATFLLGLGATLSDLVYILLAYIGITPLLVRVPWIFPLLYLVGAAILARMAWSTIRQTIRRAPGALPTVPAAALEGEEAGTPAGSSRAASGSKWRRSPLLLGFALGTVNPVAIATWMSFGVAFIAANLLRLPTIKALGVIVSISIGSALWFIMLAGLIGLARVSLTRLPTLLRAIALLSGMSLLGFALTFVWRGLQLVWH
jgi:threonine/homoserine/homoserine lactone efflux protein